MADAIDEEERRRLLEAVRAEKARRAAGKQALQQLSTAKRQVGIPTGAVTNLANLEVEAAIAQNPPADSDQALVPQLAALRPEEVERIKTASAQLGGRDVNFSPGQDLSTDIEGALLRPGAREITANDQRMVVDEYDSPLATRTEYPSVPRHIADYVSGQPNAASFIGVVDNALQALVRPVATATNYRIAPPQKPDTTALDVIGDIAKSSINAGTGVQGGGMVAKRGSGFGDTLRLIYREAMAGNIPGIDPATATRGDLIKEAVGRLAVPIAPGINLGRELMGPAAVGAFDAGITGLSKVRAGVRTASDVLERIIAPLNGVDPSIVDMAPENRPSARSYEDEWRAKFDPSLPLSTLSGEDDPFFDVAGHFTGMGADPLNAIGAGEIRAAGKLGAAAARKVPVVGEVAARGIEGAAVRDLTKAFSPEAKLERRLFKDMVANGVNPDDARVSARRIAEERYAREAGVRAEGQHETIEQFQLLTGAAKDVSHDEAAIARQLLEGGESIPKKPGDLPWTIENKADLQLIQELRAKAEEIGWNGLTTEEIALLKAFDPGGPAPSTWIDPPPPGSPPPDLSTPSVKSKGPDQQVWPDAVPTQNAMVGPAQRMRELHKDMDFVGAAGPERQMLVETYDRLDADMQALEASHKQMRQQGTVIDPDEVIFLERLRDERSVVGRMITDLDYNNSVASKNISEAPNRMAIAFGDNHAARAANEPGAPTISQVKMGSPSSGFGKAAGPEAVTQVALAKPKGIGGGPPGPPKVRGPSGPDRPPHIPQALLNRRIRLAQKLGVDPYQPHPWMKGTDAEQRMLSAAKKVGTALRRNLEIDQELGLMKNKGLRGNGYFPRASRAELAARLAKAGVPKAVVEMIERAADPFLKKLPYDPRAPREMMRLGDAEALKRAVMNNVEDIRQADPEAANLLMDFVKSERLDPAEISYVRRELERHGAQVEPPKGTIDEAQKAVEARRSHGKGRNIDENVNFNDDLVMGPAAYRNAMAPEQMHQAIVASVKQLRDANGRAIVQDLRDAVRNPLWSKPDKGLIQRLDSDVRGGGRPYFQDDKGSLATDVKKFLRDNGMVYVGAGDELSRVFGDSLTGSVIPRALYHDLLKVSPRLGRGPLAHAAGVMAKLTNLWVPIVLNTFGFHARNAFFGMFQVYLAVGSKIANVKMWKLARDLTLAAEKGGLAEGMVKIGKREYRVADIVEELRSLGVYEGGRVADLEGAVKRGLAPYRDEWARDIVRRFNPFSDRGLVTKEPLAKTVVARGMGGGATMENVQRTFIYLANRSLGMEKRSAAREVVKYMFDYTGAQLGPFEKQLRQWMPFYQWIKQSMLLTVDQMLKEPRRYAQVNRLYEMFDEMGRNGNKDPRDVPPHLGELGAVRLSESDDGSRQFGIMERPGTQGSWLIDPIARHDAPGIAKALGQNLNPIAGIMAERLTGEQMLGDRPLDANETGISDTAIERLFGMQAENIPSYLGRKFVGGYPSLGLDMLLAQINPEFVSRNPRFTGQDESNRFMNRLISMGFGPRIVDTKDEEVRGSNVARVGKDIKGEKSNAVERAKRRTMNKD